MMSKIAATSRRVKKPSPVKEGGPDKLKSKIRFDLSRGRDDTPAVRFYDPDGLLLCQCTLHEGKAHFIGPAEYTGTIAAITASGGDLYNTELDDEALQLGIRYLMVDQNVHLPVSMVYRAIERYRRMRKSHYWSFLMPAGCTLVEFLNDRWEHGWRYIGRDGGPGYLFERRT